MQKNSRNSRRKLLKRASGVNLYADQATQVQAIMESVGAKKEAPVLRTLLDEALAARRRKSVDPRAPEPPEPTLDINEVLQTIQMLLLKLIRQNDTALRAQGISLVLIQETLAEAIGSRKIVWSRLVVPHLMEAAVPLREIDERLAADISEAKDQAYALADEIRETQSRKLKESQSSSLEGELPFEDPED
jgi:hypothetical protein